MISSGVLVDLIYVLIRGCMYQGKTRCRAQYVLILGTCEGKFECIPEFITLCLYYGLGQRNTRREQNIMNVGAIATMRVTNGQEHLSALPIHSSCPSHNKLVVGGEVETLHRACSLPLPSYCRSERILSCRSLPVVSDETAVLCLVLSKRSSNLFRC